LNAELASHDPERKYNASYVKCMSDAGKVGTDASSKIAEIARGDNNLSKIEELRDKIKRLNPEVAPEVAPAPVRGPGMGH
jgi:hypothetical protein